MRLLAAFESRETGALQRKVVLHIVKKVEYIQARLLYNNQNTHIFIE